MTAFSDETLEHKLKHLEEALWKILGIKPVLYRPGYGNLNDRTLKFLNKRGYTVVLWGLDTGDSAGSTPRSE